MTPADRWRSELEAWRIPEHLLAAADESPYGWSQRAWKRRSHAASTGPEPRTLTVIRSLLPHRGSVLDVGAGRGRASLPLADAGHRLIAVERDAGMTAGLRADAGERGLSVEIIEGSWPSAAVEIGAVDVVMSAHVVYDVHEIVPFLSAMQDHAHEAVVIELSDTHPWAGLASYYRELHGLERPDGPTADDLVEVIAWMTGEAPQVERWQRTGGLYFEDMEELREMFGRRLVLPRARWSELDEVLDITEADGRLYVGDEQRELVTVWWHAPD